MGVQQPGEQTYSTVVQPTQTYQPLHQAQAMTVEGMAPAPQLRYLNRLVVPTSYGIGTFRFGNRFLPGLRGLIPEDRYLHTIERLNEIADRSNKRFTKFCLGSCFGLGALAIVIITLVCIVLTGIVPPFTLFFAGLIAVGCVICIIVSRKQLKANLCDLQDVVDQENNEFYLSQAMRFEFSRGGRLYIEIYDSSVVPLLIQTYGGQVISRYPQEQQTPHMHHHQQQQQQQQHVIQMPTHPSQQPTPNVVYVVDA